MRGTVLKTKSEYKKKKRVKNVKNYNIIIFNVETVRSDEKEKKYSE